MQCPSLTQSFYLFVPSLCSLCSAPAHPSPYSLAASIRYEVEANHAGTDARPRQTTCKLLGNGNGFEDWDHDNALFGASLLGGCRRSVNE